jgi:replication-associated recombination protein RarA
MWPTSFGEIVSLSNSKNAVYFDGSNSTNRILDERPKIILLDELDKLGRQFREKLLMFLENGRIKID